MWRRGGALYLGGSRSVNSRGASRLNKDQIAERGARMHRPDDRAYGEYAGEDQPSRRGCPAREVVFDQRGHATGIRPNIVDGGNAMRTHPGATTCALAAALVLAAPARSSAQLGQQIGQIRHNSGQNVVPVFEGWERNPDGTFNLLFGYMNRNYAEEPEIPIGPDNNFSPGPADQGQATHFYPRRQQFMFKVKVPADFGKKELVWTLTRNGQTEKAYGTLMMEEQITDVVISENRGGLGEDSGEGKPNRPPTISIDELTTRTVSGGEPGPLTALASDDGGSAPPPQRGRGHKPHRGGGRRGRP